MRRHEQVVWKRLNNGMGVVLDLRSGGYFTLNMAATSIFDLLEGGASPTVAAERVAEKFSLEKEQAHHDVNMVVKAMCDRGLLEFLPDESFDAELPESMTVVADPPAAEQTYSSPALSEHAALEKVLGSVFYYYYTGYYYYYY